MSLDDLARLGYIRLDLTWVRFVSVYFNLENYQIGLVWFAYFKLDQRIDSVLVNRMALLRTSKTFEM